jgi:hypothetical protein
VRCAKRIGPVPVRPLDANGVAGIALVVIRDGAQITTIEGLTDSAGNGRLHRLQQAFIDEDAFRCGYCTPGRIMSGVGCIAEGHTGSPAETREWMSGNVCRCGAYTNIVKAVVTAARTHLHVFPFRYSKAADEQTALRAGAAGTRYLAGSTTLVDLMRETVERRDALVDIRLAAALSPSESSVGSASLFFGCHPACMHVLCEYQDYKFVIPFTKSRIVCNLLLQVHHRYTHAVAPRRRGTAARVGVGLLP